MSLVEYVIILVVVVVVVVFLHGCCCFYWRNFIGCSDKITMWDLYIKVIKDKKTEVKKTFLF